MRLPKYVKHIYKTWRTQNKHHKHIYLRTPHAKILTRKSKQFQKQLRDETENPTAAFSLSNLIELMVQQLFSDEPEIERHAIREAQRIKEITDE